MSEPLTTDEQLPGLARALALMAKDSSRYHQCSDYRDTINEILRITQPVAEAACLSMIAEMEARHRG